APGGKSGRSGRPNSIPPTGLSRFHQDASSRDQRCYTCSPSATIIRKKRCSPGREDCEYEFSNSKLRVKLTQTTRYGILSPPPCKLTGIYEFTGGKRISTTVSPAPEPPFNGAQLGMLAHLYRGDMYPPTGRRR